MTLSTADATTYISANVINSDDWLGADTTKQQAILNVAQRELKNYCDDNILTDEAKYTTYTLPNGATYKMRTPPITTYTLPDEAVYEYAANLALVFNDTNKMQQQGIAGMSITGVGSFTYANPVTTASEIPLYEFIPKSAKRLIEDANLDLNVKLGNKNVGWIV